MRPLLGECVVENFVQVNVGQFFPFFCGGGGGRGGSMRCHGIRAWGRRTNCRWGESMEATWIEYVLGISYSVWAWLKVGKVLAICSHLV